VFAGEPREVLVSAPAHGTNATGKLPLVIVLHGGGMSAEAMREYADLESRARAPAVFAYPSANVRNVWQGEYALHWDGAKDLPFVDAMLEDLANAFQIDRAKVYVFGLSSGAYFANELGCARAKSIAAIAAIEGGGPYGTCEGRTSALIAHDEDDPVVPPSEGKASLEHWLHTDDCGLPSTSAQCVEAHCKANRVESCRTRTGLHAVAPGIREEALRFFSL
jgi:polyhydroxybutyrate depolymerase